MESIVHYAKHLTFHRISLALWLKPSVQCFLIFWSISQSFLFATHV